MPSSIARRLALVLLVAIATLVLPVGLSWLAESMFGVVLIWAWTRPNLREVATVIVLAVGMYVLRCFLAPQTGTCSVPLLCIGYYLGWAGLLLLAWRAPSPAYTGAACLPLFVLLRWLGLFTFPLGTGPTADGYLFLIDHAIGDPAYTLGQWFARQGHAYLVGLDVGYRALMLTLALAYSVSVQDAPRRNRILLSWILATVLSVPCYLLVPIAGPAYAFAGWPSLPTGVGWGPLVVPPGRIRTGFPSLHLTWALLTWLLAPPSPAWIRRVLLAFVLLTCLTTLALGMHFSLDLVAALPFTAFVLWLTSRVIPANQSVPRPAAEPWPFQSAATVAMGCVGLGWCAILATGWVRLILGGITIMMACIASLDLYRLSQRGPSTS